MLEAAPVKYFEIDWYAGVFPKRDDCLAVLKGVQVV
jgi:hypothetical protein